MYWFRRPPYLRWTAAIIIVALALWMDLREAPTELRPFALTIIEAGTRVEPHLVEYREVPAGLLPEVDLGGFTIGAIAAGEPITSAVLSDRAALPTGWWALEMEAPAGTVPGMELRLVVDGEPDLIVPAIVTSLIPSEQAGGWSRTLAMVAIPAEHAAAVATARAEGRLSVLIVDW